MINLPEPDSLIKPHEYEKFHALFERAFPRPKRKAQVAQWKFKRELAWCGWRLARDTPHETPKNSLTRCSIQGLTPTEVEALWAQKT